MKITPAVLFLVVCLTSSLEAQITASERQNMDKIFGTTGEYVTPEGTYRLSFPRIDAKVMVDNQSISPFLGLESWAAFTSDPHHGGVMLAAELALLEDEVNPVLSVALDRNLAITAIANHYLFEKPRVVFMQVSGLGEPVALATKIQELREKVKAIRTANPKPSTQFAGPNLPSRQKSNITAPVLDSILGTHGQAVDGMYKASMGMAGTIFGVPAGKQTGLRTWIAFAGSDGNAVVDGQIVVTSSQVHDVLHALRQADINITSLHNHFINSNPDFYFVHYWGNGQAVQLAQGIRRAMETQLK